MNKFDASNGHISLRSLYIFALSRVVSALHNIPININLINFESTSRPFRELISKCLCDFNNLMACYKLAFVARHYVYELIDKARFKGMGEGLQSIMFNRPAFLTGLMKYISSYFVNPLHYTI